MWLKLGTYYDKDSVAEVISALEKAGIRWDVKQCIDWDFEERYFLKGKLSKLKRLNNYEVNKWEKYIKIIRKILEKPISKEEFEQEFFKEIGINDPIDRIVIREEIYNFLRMNGVEIDDRIIGEIPEDPDVFIELDYECENADKVYVLILNRSWDVFVDCTSLLDAKLDEINDVDLRCILEAVARIFANVLYHLVDLKSCSIKDLKEFSIGAVECLNKKFVIDAEDILEDILKSFERVGFIKIREGRVSLR